MSALHIFLIVFFTTLLTGYFLFVFILCCKKQPEDFVSGSKAVWLIQMCVLTVIVATLYLILENKKATLRYKKRMYAIEEHKKFVFLEELSNIIN